MSPHTSAPTTVLEGSAPGVSRGIVRLAITGTLLLAAGSFWLSYFALRDLAILSGIPSDNAWVWPLIVDGVILEATISVVALADARREARRFAWLLLTSGAFVSVAANITHALIVADARVPALVAAAVASIPPLVLLASTHLTVELIRSSRTPAPKLTPTSQHRRPKTRTEAHLPVVSVAHEAATGSVSRAAEERAALPPPGGSRRRRSDAERAQARRMAAEDPALSHRQIGDVLGVHPTTISRWLAAPEEDTGRSFS